jgi:transcriptional antiterminator RfaH
MKPILLNPLEQPSKEEAEKRWYLAYTKPRQEQIAMVNLVQQGFESYLPLYKKIKNAEKGLVTLFEPMFPRYILFKTCHSKQSIGTVNYTKGVSNIVRFGFEPAHLPDEVVTQIRLLETARNNSSAQELSQLKAGKKVTLKHSALKCLEGVIQSVASSRVMVLLEILSRPTLISMEHHQVEVKS